jgi:hypothetical protein
MMQMSRNCRGIDVDFKGKFIDVLRSVIRGDVGERRDAATVVNEFMEDWLFTTPRALD